MSDGSLGSSLAIQVADLVRAARDYVQRATGCSVDLSVESLAYMDHYLRTVRQAGPISDELRALLAAALGAHLGEVAIARFGGRWRESAPHEHNQVDDRDPAGWQVELDCVPLWFAPVGMAAEALASGEVDGYDGSLRTRPDLLGPLQEALERTAPVTEEYYYSLTGRFETVAFAVELLAELERQRRERAGCA
ncbi:MAG: hypothetical protein RMK29_14945 [Myxococcales bacterium]|nr:hypothetical protein [Myxococcota bacterium]MDW8283011.1 hypothetical protein [Myxococcales bacterium]